LDTDEVFSLEDLDYLDKVAAESLNSKVGAVVAKLRKAVTKPPINVKFGLEEVKTYKT
jgi:hypothetical protein